MLTGKRMKRLPILRAWRGPQNKLTMSDSAKCRWRFLVYTSFALLCAAPISAEQTVSGGGSQWVLSTHCPPSFEKTAEGACRLRTLYEVYPETRGFGGMQVRLPPARDGFSPEQIDLGRLLFFDPILSGNKGRSCSDCHNPARGFAGELTAS